MENSNEFVKGFKEGLGILHKGSIFLVMDEVSFNMDKIKDNVLNYLKNEGKECSYVGISAGRHIILLDGKKYIVKISGFMSKAPCQKVILIPEE